MRRTIRGAAAVAALCTGALAFSSVAIAAPSTTSDGSGYPAGIIRVAGTDRIQTSLEALQEVLKASPSSVEVFIVGYNGVVDALSLAPLAAEMSDDNSTASKAAITIYSGPEGLDNRVVKALTELKKTGKLSGFVVSGGYGAVPANVEGQLIKVLTEGMTPVKEEDGVPDARYTNEYETPKSVLGQIKRIDGMDRYKTAYLTGAYVLDKSFPKVDVAGAADKVNLAKFSIEMLAKFKASYETARDARDAAVDARAAAAVAEAEAHKVYAQELAKVKNADVAKYAKNMLAALKSNKVTLKAMEELAKIKGFASTVSATTNDPTKVTLGEIKGDAEVAKAVLVLTDDAAAEKEGVKGQRSILALADTTTVEEMNIKIEKAMNLNDAALKAGDKTIANQQILMQEAAVNAGLLADPTSDVSVAAKAWKDAQQAKKDAREALDKARSEFIQAKTAYVNLYKKSAVDDFYLDRKMKNFDKAVAEVYKKNTDKKHIFLSTGVNFADALAAGPAAAANNGLVLLTNGAEAFDYVKAAADVSEKTVYGIGGAAAKAYPKAKGIVGSDRYATSAKVAGEFFPVTKGGVYALASGETGADAVVAGAYLATKHVKHPSYRGVLLTMKNQLPNSVADFIQYGDHSINQKPVGSFVVFGGEGVIARGVAAEASALVHN